MISIFLETGTVLRAAGSRHQASGVEAATMVLLQRRVLALCVPGAHESSRPTTLLLHFL